MRLVRAQLVPRARDEVFAFFGDPRNLELLTPRWLHFRILDQPDTLAEGSTIDYALRLHGVPLRWRSRIAAWQPPHGFVDEQLRGPYRRWVHRHTFAEVEGGTLVRDEVEYAVPGGRLVDRLFVRSDLRRIFDHRASVLTARFGAATPCG